MWYRVNFVWRRSFSLKKKRRQLFRREIGRILIFDLENAFEKGCSVDMFAFAYMIRFGERRGRDESVDRRCCCWYAMREENPHTQWYHYWLKKKKRDMNFAVEIE